MECCRKKATIREKTKSRTITVTSSRFLPGLLSNFIAIGQFKIIQSVSNENIYGDLITNIGRSKPSSRMEENAPNFPGGFVP